MCCRMSASFLDVWLIESYSQKGNMVIYVGYDNTNRFLTKISFCKKRTAQHSWTNEEVSCENCLDMYDDESFWKLLIDGSF